MRSISLLAVALLQVAVHAPDSAQAALNTWTRIGPAGGRFNDVAVDPQTPATLFTGGAGGGVFKSTNSGMVWTAHNAGITEPDIQALAVDPQSPSTLYAGSDFGGVYKTTSGGVSWNAANSGFGFPLDSPRVFALAIDPKSPNVLYAGVFGVSGHVVFRSPDGAASWTNRSTGITSPNISAMTIDPLNTGTLYVGTSDAGVFRTTSAGISWMAGNNGLLSLHIRALAVATAGFVFAGTADAGVFKSTNGGASWVPARSGLTALAISALAVDPKTPSTVYAGTENGEVFKSTNVGESWTLVHGGLPAVNKLRVDPQSPATLYAATDDGVFRSTDGSEDVDGREHRAVEPERRGPSDRSPGSPHGLRRDHRGRVPQRRRGGVLEGGQLGPDQSLRALTRHRLDVAVDALRRHVAVTSSRRSMPETRGRAS